MDLIVLYAAEVDLQLAYQRYEDQQTGLGTKFLEYVESGILQVRRFPQSGFQITQKHRRLLLKKFPYEIFYSIYPTRIVVSAILDLTQNPSDIGKRLNE
jgi:hypothetical protein